MTATGNMIRENDVLLGRGGATNNNNGNIRFREIVASKQIEYLDAKKKEKRSIAQDCVETVKKNGGRFLRRDNASGSWVEVPMVQAVKKASQALREGLDVRHKRMREGKSGLVMSSPQKKKRQKVVSGSVAGGSPALVSLAGEENAVPELRDEQKPQSAALLYQAPPVSDKDCNNVMEV